MTRIYQPVAAGAGGAPSGPAGGQLAGLYPDPTVAASHSGSTHAATQTAAEATAAAAAAVHVALPDAHHAASHTLASHSAKAHSDLTGIGATDHHSNANDHASTNDPTANQKAALAGTGTPSGTDKYVSDSDARNTNSRTPVAHVLDGALHTVSGLTIGHVLKATGAATAAFGQLLHSQLGSVGADDHHAQVHGSAAHSGTIGAHTDLSAVTSDQHHAQAHHATHEPSGNDVTLVASGSYTPGAMTVPDGTWLIAVGKYKLTSTLALIARGTAAVKVIGEAR